MTMPVGAKRLAALGAGVLVIAAGLPSQGAAEEPSTITAITVPLPQERDYRLCARHSSSPQCVNTGIVKGASLVVDVRYAAIPVTVAVIDCGSGTGFGVLLTSIPEGAIVTARVMAPGTTKGAERAKVEIAPVEDRGVCFFVE